LTTTVGQYVTAGQPIFILASTQQWFVIANFRETDIRNMQPGDEATVYLMGNSGVSYPAVIDSVGYGVIPTDGSILPPGLPAVSRSINWVHVAQRFPVRLRVMSTHTDAFRIGASAVAVIKPSTEDKVMSGSAQ
ncbi:MAG: HlyD family efflux transporter periplasmic adaptor subunit, partial [Morganella morganii]